MTGHHLYLIFLTMFAWPAGIVLGNLMASLLWVPVQWAGIHLRLTAHNAAMQARMDAHDAKLTEIIRRLSPELLTPDETP
jgi:hypothetical protein